MKAITRKICTHCGKETYPQPQDFQHDLGFGHCSDCLMNENWYYRKEYQDNNLFLCLFFEMPIFNDDSGAKVTEVFTREGGCIYHQTRYSLTRDIIDGLSKHFKCDFKEI